MSRAARVVTRCAYGIIGAAALVSASTLLPVHANAPVPAVATVEPGPVTAVTTGEQLLPEQAPVTVTPAPEPEQAQAQAVDPAQVPIMEDDPAWDCRVMGNRECGTQIAGTWYVVTFDETGQPTSVRER